MAKYPVADIRNIAFCGHGSAGKTTLVDRMLLPHRHVQPAGQRRRRHQHLRLRRRREAAQVHDRVHGGPFRPCRQALSSDRHPGLSRLYRPDDRRLAGGGHGGGGDQRPVGHRGEHPAGVRRGEEGGAGAAHRAQQDGRARTSISPSWWRTSRRCSARRACC